jgi:transcription elongation factor Elf1
MQTCVISTQCATGNCQLCEQQADCVLLQIMQKINQLQNTMDEIKDKLPQETRI